MENEKFIYLIDDADLKIFMHPLRQKIIREMALFGRPITAKELADKLSIAPSSAQHHLKKLQSLGIVEFDHSKLINGITARYLKLSNATVSFGMDIDNINLEERNVIAESNISKVIDGFKNTCEYAHKNATQEKREFYGDSLSGIVHLTTEDAMKLQKIILEFTSSHHSAEEDTHPWEYAVVAYRTDYEK